MILFQSYTWCSPPPQVYYPVRHHLVQHMISAMQRLGFTPSVTIEQRKLAVDLAEVVIKWELQRIKDQQVNHIIFTDFCWCQEYQFGMVV